MDKNCVFCDRLFELNYETGIPGHSSIVYQDDNVMIIPDISPLVLGHALIVSKKHISSFGNANKEIMQSLLHAQKYIQAGQCLSRNHWVFFEHGAVMPNSGGSSIDHAHLHALPLQVNLLNLFRVKTFPSLILKSSNQKLNAMARNSQPYVRLIDNFNGDIIIPVDGLPSQFMRIIIAEYVGSNFDWRSNYKTRSSKELFIQSMAWLKEHLIENVRLSV